jgi:16S rRNA (uracil1498-N3)-methyltransferase
MRVFVSPNELVAGELQIRGDEHHYLARVRRAAVGNAVELVDGEGRRANAQIMAMTDDVTTLRVYEPQEIPSPLPRIRVLLPLIKGDRMDYALEKLVEVGCDEIVVWPAARSVVKLEADRRESRIEKFQLAVQAAARQSGRAQVPRVTWADSLARAVDGIEGTRLALDPMTDVPIAIDDASEVTIASGPEGGLTADERAQLAGFKAVSLGPRVLRAETAPVAAVAIVRALTRS